MDAIPAVSATSLSSQEQHYQTPSSTSASGPAAGFYQNVTDAAIMQVLQDGLSGGNGEPLTHLSVPEPEGVPTPHTPSTEPAAVTTDSSTAEDSQPFSHSAINSLASALGVNLTNQAAQMLMVRYTMHHTAHFFSLPSSLSLPLSLSPPLSSSLHPDVTGSSRHSKCSGSVPPQRRGHAG